MKKIPRPVFIDSGKDYQTHSWNITERYFELNIPKGVYEPLLEAESSLRFILRNLARICYEKIK